MQLARFLTLRELIRSIISSEMTNRAKRAVAGKKIEEHHYIIVQLPSCLFTADDGLSNTSKQLLMML